MTSAGGEPSCTHARERSKEAFCCFSAKGLVFNARLNGCAAIKPYVKDGVIFGGYELISSAIVPKRHTYDRSEIVNRRRVVDHGEVFTNAREIRAMIAHVTSIGHIETRVLEPACGNGNFLHEILKEKLHLVAGLFKKNLYEYEQNLIAAVASIYGIELLPDNVIACKSRLLALCEEEYKRITKKPIPSRYRSVIEHLLTKNIIRGDALTMKYVGRVKKPIVFSEWTFVTGGKVKRRDYELVNLMTQGGKDGSQHISDMQEFQMIPLPVATYPLRHFLDLIVDA